MTSIFIANVITAQRLQIHDTLLDNIYIYIISSVPGLHTRHAMADCVEFSGVLEEKYEIQLVTVSSHMEGESSKYVYTTDREMYNS